MLIQAMRNTFRSWRRTPALAVGVLLTLSLGVGVNAAVFSVVHAVLFRPLPYPASERLVELFEVEPARGAFRASVLNYVSWAERSKTFEALATLPTGTDRGALLRSGVAPRTPSLRIAGHQSSPSASRRVQRGPSGVSCSA